MIELDLDALEREVVESPEKWPVVALRLIQRLREAEERERQHRREMDLLDSFHKTRSAQLERVRAAASKVVDFMGPTVMWDASVNELLAALGAVEEST